jgi:hypothetical protein
MQQRPISITVFGVLNIGYAAWKIVGLALTAVMMRMKLPGNPALAAMKTDPMLTTWSHVNMVITVVFGIALIASGIGLLLLQNWARLLGVVYSILEMILVVVGACISYPLVMKSVATAQVPGAPAGLIGAITQVSFVVGIAISLAYPALLLIFMTRPKVVEAFRAPEAPQAN